MALPLLAIPVILKGAAIAAGVIGVGAGVAGGVVGIDAHLTMKEIKERHNQNMAALEYQQNSTAEDMDKLGTLELEILKTFEFFSDTIEKIHNRPEFKDKRYTDLDIPSYQPDKMREVSVGAGMLLSGLGATALGTAGGFAASGATTAAVMAFGTASTGTAISTLSGAALTNATLAALGGGAVAAGGGGMAVGAVVLKAAALGAGLLAGGVVIGLAGFKFSEKSDEAKDQMLIAEAHIEKVCAHLKELSHCAVEYTNLLKKTKGIYMKKLDAMNLLVNKEGVTNWDDFSEEDKLNVENTVLLVGLLHKMCQVQLVLPHEESDETGINSINLSAIGEVTSHADRLLVTVK